MENKLGQAEFEEVLLDNISPMILNQNYMETYSSFMNTLFYNLWKEYYFSDTNNSVRHYAKIVDIFFGSMFTNPASAEKTEDIVKLH